MHPLCYGNWRICIPNVRIRLLTDFHCVTRFIYFPITFHPSAFSTPLWDTYTSGFISPDPWKVSKGYTGGPEQSTWHPVQFQRRIISILIKRNNFPTRYWYPFKFASSASSLTPKWHHWPSMFIVARHRRTRLHKIYRLHIGVRGSTNNQNYCHAPWVIVSLARRSHPAQQWQTVLSVVRQQQVWPFVQALPSHPIIGARSVQGVGR